MSDNGSLTISKELYEEKAGAITNSELIDKAIELLEKMAENSESISIRELSIEFILDGKRTNFNFYDYR